MDANEIEEYVKGLERRIEILGNENAALTMTMNKLMMENKKLKSEIQSLQKILSELEHQDTEHIVKFE
jgi:regulator of replication initiation timing